jgi:hypothetical protein
MAEEPSHIKQLSLIHVCKIGLSKKSRELMYRKMGNRSLIGTMEITVEAPARCLVLICYQNVLIIT